MGRFERVWAGEREPRLRAVPAAAGAADEETTVAAFRRFADQLMAGARGYLSPRSLDLRKLRLTESLREALRQAPAEQAALLAVWDAAYRVLERLHWELAPPAIDPPPPPPPPTFEEVRDRYEAMRRERERQAEARHVTWHPLEVGPASTRAAPADDTPEDDMPADDHGDD